MDTAARSDRPVGTAAQPLPEKPRVKGHLGYLDGIRGLAALYVVLHHTWLIYAGGMLAVPGLIGFATNWLLYGHLAVDVFIVLSGFCLILSISENGIVKGGAAAFFRKRARRILPPYFAALLFCVAIRFIAQHLTHRHLDHPLTLNVLLANGLLLEDLLPRYNVLNQPFWSVALEWKIYFMFPVIVLLLWRFGAAVTLFAAAMVGYGLTLGLHLLEGNVALDHTCPWYLFLFALGCVAGTSFGRSFATHKRSVFFPLVGLLAILSVILMIVYPVATATSPDNFSPKTPIIDAIFGGLVAMLLTWSSLDAGEKRRPGALVFLSQRPIVFLGTFAYSLYLTHFPLLEILHPMLSHLPQSLSLISAFGCVPIAVGAAYLFFIVFERPFMSSRSQQRIKQEVSSGQ